MSNYQTGDKHWTHRDPSAVPAGDRHYAWKGDAAVPRTGRGRALKLFSDLGSCACGQPAVERHHVDRNLLNNDPINVQLLCGTCHGVAHRGDKKAPRAPKPPKSCTICGQPAKPLRVGRCPRCASYLRDHGVERPESLWVVTRGQTVCQECAREAPPLRRGLCSRCDGRKRRPATGKAPGPPKGTPRSSNYGKNKAKSILAGK